MRGAQEWLKANGGPPALVIVGIGLSFASLAVGLGFIVVGLLGWLYAWDRFPLTLVRRESHPPNERRELLGLVQAVTTELETCRYRLAEAKTTKQGWLRDRQLPAETFNAGWTPSLLTADRITVNDALRGFYVWADELNGQLAARADAEATAIGMEFRGKGRALDSDDLEQLDEGLNRIQTAQAALMDVAVELQHNGDAAWVRPLVAGLLVGGVLGFGVGLAVLEWKPWESGNTPNRFIGLSCAQRESQMNIIETERGPVEVHKAGKERAAAEERESCGGR
jgi:hypothetical protein